MPRRVPTLFSAKFIERLRYWIGAHHALYPRVPPQGIYFESLVERSFLEADWPRAQVVLENPNSPKADIKVGNTRLSLKTETGRITRRGSISITKLCTTETGDWASTALIEHAISHLSRCRNLMLRAVWGTSDIDYQLVDIPVTLLQKMRAGEALPVGKRPNRQSLGFDVVEGNEVLFHVHFDAYGTWPLSRKCSSRQPRRRPLPGSAGELRSCLANLSLLAHASLLSIRSARPQSVLVTPAALAGRDSHFTGAPAVDTVGHVHRLPPIPFRTSAGSR